MHPDLFALKVKSGIPTEESDARSGYKFNLAKVLGVTGYIESPRFHKKTKTSVDIS